MAKRKLIGEWAVVTGASSGIGLEFTRQLAAMGANVLMISNQAEALAQCGAEVAAANGVETAILYVDLATPEAVDEVMAAIRKLPKVPMLLVNNAGIFDFRAVSGLSERRINLYIDLHMRCVTLLSRAVGALMAQAGRGHILNMSSMSCWMPMPGIAMYSATKAYIRAFSRAYRVEMLHTGVTVTVACPGGIATDLFGLPDNLKRLALNLKAITTPQKFVRKALKRTLKGKAQYINGFINRVAIVFVASSPEWARRLIKTKLLDRLSHD